MVVILSVILLCSITKYVPPLIRIIHIATNMASSFTLLIQLLWCTCYGLFHFRITFFLNFRNQWHLVGLFGRLISRSQGLYLHNTTQHTYTHTDRDSNPFSKYPSGKDLRVRPHGHRLRLLLYVFVYNITHQDASSKTNSLRFILILWLSLPVKLPYYHV